MIVAIVTFKLSKPWTLSQASNIFKSTAPKYLGMPGLIRKNYFLSENGKRTGGIYFWESKEFAEACYNHNSQWSEVVKKMYGVVPEIIYAEIPVTVDNIIKQIQID
ncbi:YdhR family protein [Morganella morganii]|uniref:YdhR family protein n=1 Tax=Morganella morganii TaxID=582 RepID=UPI00128C8EC3|nr:YdhR family protein [Morganella morganii]MQC09062.1 monooxygenase [Morganella morganii]MQC12650.1 monooxygenase [Morganella morganii]MQC16400.1 monooxygenase [Morganella morganii]